MQSSTQVSKMVKTKEKDSGSMPYSGNKKELKTGRGKNKFKHAFLCSNNFVGLYD